MHAKQEELEEIAMAVAEDPGAPGFARLAEAHRALGRAEDARRVAEAGLARSPDDLAGQLVLALSLLDLSDVDRARGQLCDLLERQAGFEPELHSDVEEAAPPFEADLADSELDRAFDGAESQPESMMDVNKVAAAAMHAEALDEPEELFNPSALPTFATETMASLLEGQGDSAGAETIRSGLGAGGLASGLTPGLEAEGLEADEWGVSPGVSVAEALDVSAVAAREDRNAASRERVINTLQRWLTNSQRGRNELRINP